MRRRKPRLHRVVVALVVPSLLGFASSPPPHQGSASPISGHPDWAALAYANAAAALRAGNCPGAYAALNPVLSTRGSEASFGRLLSGLYASACNQAALAEDRLFNATNPGGALEDWRLLLLSRAAAAQGHTLLAQTSLARLIGDYPNSPLRRRAMVEAATLAWRRGDVQRALDLVERARRDGLRGEEGTALEALAWQIGTQLGQAQVRAKAARQLLIYSPPKAAELQVANIFRSAKGVLDWSIVLTPEELEARARVLLDLNLGPSALDSLDAVPAAQRDLDWALLRARALTQGHRGAEALALLAERQGTSPRESAALEWERASAASDAAVARNGGPTLNAAKRQQLRDYAQQHYEKVALIGADPALAAKALRTLYVDQMSDEQFERGVDMLRRLRKLDAKDTTGAVFLWQLGWREFGRGNYSGAVGDWTELYALYPETSQARSGRYWTARAFDALGEDERAQQIYGEVVQADTADFYRRAALGRLRGKGAARLGEEPRPEPWPNEPALVRARLLADVGLDDLALEEAKLAGPGVDRRASRALEALILARRGKVRDSVLAIRDAFPALGGPFQAAVPDEARRLYYPVLFEDAIRAAAQTNGLPPSLVFGIIRQESAFDLRARSRAGAAGLMQVMPATGRELAGKLGLPYSAESLYDPALNVRLGSTYFRQVMGMFGDNLELSLAGYNGGPYRIRRMWNEAGAGEVDRFVEGLNLAEPITYVKRILVLSDSYRQLYPPPG